MSTPYRQAPPRVTRRVLQFSDLQPETRARLAQLCHDEWSPGLLAGDWPLRWPLRRALGLSVAVGLTSLGGLFSLLAPWLSHPSPALGRPGWVVVAAAALVVAVLSALRVLLRMREHAGLEFEPGVYLFARDLIDVRPGVLAVYPTEALLSLQRRGFPGAIWLYFEGGVRFRVESPAAGPTELTREIERVRAQLDEAEASGDGATLASRDPLGAERAGWEQPAGPARLPGPWPVRLGVAAASASLAVGFALGLDQRAVQRATEARDTDTLARFARGSEWASEEADRAWLDLALQGNDERALGRYSVSGMHPGRASAALGGRCQGDGCWLGMGDACRLDGKADRALIERSLPYRQRLGASAAPPEPAGAARRSAWLDSLGPLLGGCRGALGARELASLDIRSAAMPPARPSLLWSYASEPSYWWIDLENAGDLSELRGQAKKAIEALYDAERARLSGLPPRPWVRAQLALLPLLAAQDAEVTFSVAHRQGFSAAPAGLVPAALAARLPRRLQGEGPLLRLREARDPDRAEPPSAQLSVDWGQRRQDASPVIFSFHWSVRLSGQAAPQVFKQNFFPEPLRYDPRASADPQALDTFIDTLF